MLQPCKLVTMSEPTAAPTPPVAAPTPPVAAPTPKKKTLRGHKITVEGFYFAFDDAGEKVKRKYSEEFTLSAHEHRAEPQGALGHLLSDKHLNERLSKKDKQFRAVQTHTVTKHENIHE